MDELTRFLCIPTVTAERRKRRLEKYARYNAKRPDRYRGRPALKDRKFIVWDGEGPRDTGYSLLGNSEGDEICYPSLRTEDCLNLLLQSAATHPYSVNVGFGFNYDVSCILHDLSWRAFNSLYRNNRCRWHGYDIEHIPRKWFRVAKDGISIKIYDVQSFFATSLVKALETWKIGEFAHIRTATMVSTIVMNDVPTSAVPALDTVLRMSERELVTTFKNLRARFYYRDIESIRLYMRLELKYTKILMERLREAFIAAGYLPKSWHGPGAIARMAFARHGIYACLTETPDSVQRAARMGFIAGRFELVKAGWFNRCVYCADINSAYPWYCSQLPNLAKGQWRHTDRIEPGKFGIYHIRYKAKPKPYAVYPLPYRDKRGNVSWSWKVTGWYWNPEAELVKDSPYATILGGWVFDEDDPNDRPFAWIKDYYELRRKYKDLGDPVEYVFKLIINSIYGQLAQRTGWDKRKKRAPKTHQLEYAGWITSSCRASVYKLAARAGSNLVSIDTDGVTSLSPFDGIQHSKKLGEWELSEYSDALYWQSGIYALKTGNCPLNPNCALQWQKARTRGIPKGTYSVQDLQNALSSGQPLKLSKKLFVTYGLAISRRFKLLNEWLEVPHVFEFGYGSKRQHIARLCAKRCDGSVHKLAICDFSDPIAENHSHEHKLPWLHTPREMMRKNIIDSYTFYDQNDLDTEDEWILSELDMNQ